MSRTVNKPKKTPAQLQYEAALRESDGEIAFRRLWEFMKRSHNLPNAPDPVYNHPYHPTRGWSLDVAWIPAKVVLEVEGWSHRTSRYESDIQKYNTLTDCDWALYRTTNKLLQQNPYDLLYCIALKVLQRQQAWEAKELSR